MTSTEPVNIRKWMIAAVCFLCVICFGLGIYVGYSVSNSNTEVDAADTVEASTSVEKIEEIKDMLEENTSDDLVEIDTVEEEPVIEEAEKTESDVGMSELEMLACVIYQEVGGDAHCDDCRYRVADVVLNRVASDEFPNTIYEVLTQEGQYGMFYWTGIKWADRASNTYEAEAVERAWRIAEDVMNGNHSELYGNGYIWQAGFEQGTDGFWCCGHFFGR